MSKWLMNISDLSTDKTNQQFVNWLAHIDTSTPCHITKTDCDDANSWPTGKFYSITEFNLGIEIDLKKNSQNSQIFTSPSVVQYQLENQQKENPTKENSKTRKNTL